MENILLLNAELQFFWTVTVSRGNKATTEWRGERVRTHLKKADSLMGTAALPQVSRALLKF